jgi:hypothetical protein
MTASLPPALAIDYLGQLSTDLRAVVVLGPGGEVLAGEAALGAPARRLLAAARAADPEADAVEVALPQGTVLAARSSTHAVAVLAGPLALVPLALFDLRAVLADLAGPPA